MGPVVFVLQVRVPLPPAPGSGVPAAAICHLALVKSRFPALPHACAAWNQVIQRAGRTPRMLRAKMAVQSLPVGAQG